MRKQLKSVLSPPAQRDIYDILQRSEQEFGRRAARRYEALIVRALRDIESDPVRPGAQPRPDLAEGIQLYHLRFSKESARIAEGIVQSPRHFIVFRRRNPLTIDIVRVLHDSSDLPRHLLR